MGVRNILALWHKGGHVRWHRHFFRLHCPSPSFVKKQITQDESRTRSAEFRYAGDEDGSNLGASRVCIKRRQAPVRSITTIPRYKQGSSANQSKREKHRAKPTETHSVKRWFSAKKTRLRHHTKGFFKLFSYYGHVSRLIQNCWVLP